MLYDPKRMSPKTAPLSLDGLIAWLAEQPVNKTYNYGNPWRCPLARYFRSKGYWFVRASMTQIDHGFFRSTKLPPHFNDVVMAYPRTYGDALIRACRCRA